MEANEIERKYARFKDASWFPKEEIFTLVGGAGGIGTYLVYFLNRAGFKTLVYDFDTIEDINLAGQMFSKSQIGQKKVFALSKNIKEFCDEDMEYSENKYTEDSESHHYVFSAFDNMQARKDMFNNWVKYVEELGEDYKTKEVPIFIDGRLNAEQLQIFCVTPDRIEEYKKHLFEDSEVEEAPCTLKQTSHAAGIIGGLMCGFFTNHISNQNPENPKRILPFYYEYIIPMNYTKVEYE